MNHPTPFEEVTSEQPWPAYWKLLPAACCCCCEVQPAGWELATAGWEEANAGWEEQGRATRRKGGGGGVPICDLEFDFLKVKY
jgi:hypothetical protein